MGTHRVAPLVLSLPVLLAIGCAAGRSPASVAAVDRTKLPLGDSKYRGSAQRGYVQSCQTSLAGPGGNGGAGGGGAGGDGPWIDATAKTWDATRKIAVTGTVKRTATYSFGLSASARKLTGNGLPSVSGTFPVAADDPAYQYDRNPNTIAGYTLSVSLSARPKMAGTSTCVGGTIGVSSKGLPIYSAFDAEGRDASAHELQDSCGGHPQNTGQYHFHALPACFADSAAKTAHSKLAGYALDGFGIYGHKGVGGKVVTNASLDACHGHTHTIIWNGKRKRMFHYHATYEFPYLVGCYRGTPVTRATGLGIGSPPGGGPPQ